MTLHEHLQVLGMVPLLYHEDPGRGYLLIPHQQHWRETGWPRGAAGAPQLSDLWACSPAQDCLLGVWNLGIMGQGCGGIEV